MHAYIIVNTEWEWRKDTVQPVVEVEADESQS